MHDNDNKMQITKSGHNVSTLAIGMASAVVTADKKEYIEVLPIDTGVYLFVGLPADDSLANARLIPDNVPTYDICHAGDVVTAYVGKAQLMY